MIADGSSPDLGPEGINPLRLTPINREPHIMINSNDAHSGLTPQTIHLANCGAALDRMSMHDIIKASRRYQVSRNPNITHTTEEMRALRAYYAMSIEILDNCIRNAEYNDEIPCPCCNGWDPTHCKQCSIAEDDLVSSDDYTPNPFN